MILFPAIDLSESEIVLAPAIGGALVDTGDARCEDGARGLGKDAQEAALPKPGDNQLANA